MKILNFGSLNIDYVYRVDRFVRAGETRAAASMQRNVGGKGLNQSVALARAGVSRRLRRRGRCVSFGLFAE